MKNQRKGRKKWFRILPTTWSSLVDLHIEEGQIRQQNLQFRNFEVAKNPIPFILLAQEREMSQTA